ncbi:MAG: RNA 2'-phosphotransferase [Deltaproteobacteria bacterium]|nr:RNA 2'-phosphotransferase [Deltaproteobacteria bacterium]
MTIPKSVSLSKLMSYALTRRPDEFGLIPDRDGFVKSRDMVRALNEEEGYGYVRIGHIHEVAHHIDRQSFELVERDGQEMIRACPPGDIAPRLAEPPMFLYYGARRKSYPVVLENGLNPTYLPHLVLCTTKEMAERIGSRRDPKPVMLTIEADKAARRGMIFYRVGELIYLVDQVPVGLFTGPPLPKEREEAPEFFTKPKKPKKPGQGVVLPDVRRPEVVVPTSPGSYNLTPSMLLTPMDKKIKHRQEKAVKDKRDKERREARKHKEKRTRTE